MLTITVEEILKNQAELEKRFSFEGVKKIKLDDIIEDVIFSGPATIIKWIDGTKTVTKKAEEDEFDYEKSIAMCMLKYLMGDASYNDIFRKYTPKELDDEN